MAVNDLVILGESDPTAQVGVDGRNTADLPRPAEVAAVLGALGRQRTPRIRRWRPLRTNIRRRDGRKRRLSLSRRLASGRQRRLPTTAVGCSARRRSCWRPRQALPSTKLGRRRTNSPAAVRESYSWRGRRPRLRNWDRPATARLAPSSRSRWLRSTNGSAPTLPKRLATFSTKESRSRSSAATIP